MSPNVSLWFHPSLEAALIEWGLILLDRNRELGAGKKAAIVGEGMDPSLRLLSQTMSSHGVSVHGTTDSTVKGSDVLVAAVCEDDRFTTRFFDSTALDSKLTDSTWSRVPVIRVRFNTSVSIPKPQEIVIYRLANGAAIAVLGERLRLEPRIAPFSLSSEFVRSSVISLRTRVAATRLANLAKSQEAIETFESSIRSDEELRQLVSPWFETNVGPKARTYSHSVLVFHDEDSFGIAETLRDLDPTLQMNRDLCPLSACESSSFIADLRTQMWLRNREVSVGRNEADAAKRIRGSLLIASAALTRIGVDQIRSVANRAGV